MSFTDRAPGSYVAGIGVFGVLCASVACGRIGYDLLGDEPESTDGVGGGGALAAGGIGGSSSLAATGPGSIATGPSGPSGSGGSLLGAGGASSASGVGSAGNAGSGGLNPGGAGAGGSGGVSGAAGAGGMSGASGAGTDAGTDAASDARLADASGTCPSQISFGAASQTPLRGGPGGTAWSDTCPTGQVVTGYSIQPATDGTIDALTTLCGVISINPINLSTCQISVSAGATLPSRGASSGTAQVTRCSGDQMVVAVRTRSGGQIDQFSFGCASLTLSQVGPTYEPSVGAITWLASVGGTGGSMFEDRCPAGFVAKGSFTRAGPWVDAFALICSRPGP